MLVHGRVPAFPKASRPPAAAWPRSDVAARKNVTLPAGPPADAKREHAKLDKLSGAAFDREYMKHMLDDHRKDVAAFRARSRSAKDPDVRSFAAETLPTLEEHLELAQAIAPAK